MTQLINSLRISLLQINNEEYALLLFLFITT